MKAMTMTHIAAMSDDEQLAWARDYTRDDPMTENDLSAILTAARNGTPAPSPEALLATALNDQIEGELRQRALLAIYYHAEAAGNTETPDDDSVEATRKLLAHIAKFPKDDNNEQTRGRKCWIRLREMVENEAPPEVIVDAVQQFCRDESSAFVLDRVAAAVSQDRRTVFSLFPQAGTWTPPDTDGWNRLQRQAITETHEAGQTLGALRRRGPALLAAAARGDKSFRYFVETLDAPEREYLVAPRTVADVLKTVSPMGRNRVLDVCTGGSTREDAPRLEQYLSDLVATTETATGKRDWVDQLSILSLKGTIANVEGHAGGARLEHLVVPALHLLSSPIPEQYDCSATRNSLSKLVGGILRVGFTDPDTTQSVLARVASGQLDLVDPLVNALRSDSAYIVNVAADVALLLSRNRTLPAGLVPPLLERLSQSHATDGDMCSGQDLKDDDIAVPDGIVLAYLSSGTDDSEETESDAEDGFFSVSALTGMLEVCREPFCAWRIAAALVAHADYTKDTELTAQLLTYSKENEVIDEWEPIANGKQTASRPTGKVNPDQPGPFTLPEIVETLGRIVAAPADGWPALQDDIAREHEQRIEGLVSQSQRSRIREVFEGPPEGGKTDLGPLVPVATQIMQRGFTSFVPHPSFVPGTLDDHGRYDRNGDIDPINSTETLAYYVARDCLPASRSHQWGIYFRVQPFAALNHTVPGTLQALVEPVAVHELVHHHTAIRTKELGITRTCGTFRILEEATADWNAVQRLTQMLSDGAITTDRYQEIMRLVFPRREDGGLPGYGDWPLMDADAAPLAPYFDSPAWDKPGPEDYRSRRQLLVIATNPPEITPIELPREHRLWSSILDAIGTGEIPMYLDFQ